MEKSRVLLSKGVLNALGDCLGEYGRYNFLAETDQVADRGNSRIDYVLKVDGEDRGLLEAESPSVMNNVRGLLPLNGIELTWARGQSLAAKMLTNVSMLFYSSTTVWRLRDTSRLH